MSLHDVQQTLCLRMHLSSGLGCKTSPFNVDQRHHREYLWACSSHTQAFARNCGKGSVIARRDSTIASSLGVGLLQVQRTRRARIRPARLSLCTTAKTSTKKPLDETAHIFNVRSVLRRMIPVPNPAVICVASSLSLCIQARVRLAHTNKTGLNNCVRK